MENLIKIAALADIHVTQNDRGKWDYCFAEISEKADIMLIAGDLTDTGDEHEAEILAESLRVCHIPVVAVLGNHDFEKGKQKEIRAILQKVGVQLLDGEAVVLKGVGFAGVKGFGGGFGKYMLSMFGEPAMKAFVQETVDEVLKLDRALAALDKNDEVIPKVALMHYSPFADTIAGEPAEIFPFLGSTRLAEPLLRRQVATVFHGHAHSGVLSAKMDNVAVYNVAYPVLKKHGLSQGYLMLEIPVKTSEVY
ncbi:MAG: metallophosphoesterase [Flavobacteriales bacterium]|nr:MAG: metallophosphoesterase [Flavobacteriales bacterium]